MSLGRTLRTYTRTVVTSVRSWIRAGRHCADALRQHSDAREVTTSGEAVTPIAWGDKKLADMTLEEALEWVFMAPPTEQELVEADALLAQMAEMAEWNGRSSGTSFVTMRMPKP